MAKTTEQLSLAPHHCAISVPNIERSIAWYRDMLGFSLEKRSHLKHLDAQVAFMVHGAFRMELFEVPGAGALPTSRRIPDKDLLTHGTKHVAFSVNSIDTLLKRLREHGVNVAMEPFEIDGMKVSFINDDSGNLIELIEQLS